MCQSMLVRLRDSQAKNKHIKKTHESILSAVRTLEFEPYILIFSGVTNPDNWIYYN